MKYLVGMRKWCPCCLFTICLTAELYSTLFSRRVHTDNNIAEAVCVLYEDGCKRSETVVVLQNTHTHAFILDASTE